MTEAWVLDRDVLPISWRECGSGAPVIFLHAMVTSRTGWDPQIQALSDRYRCIAWDMPGFGTSPALPPTAGVDEVMALIVDFVTQTLGLNRAHFVGLSVGGMILQHLAARHPELVQSITLLDCSPRFGFDGGGSGAEFLVWVAAQLANQTTAAFSESMVRAIVAPDAGEEVIQSALRSMSRATRPGLELAARLIAQHDALAQLPRISCPTLVMAGEQDRETPPAYAREIALRIRGANLSIIPGAGHIANLEAPAAVSARLQTFLEHSL
jgi:3-oxoadipate enol-lactonase